MQRTTTISAICMMAIALLAYAVLQRGLQSQSADLLALWLAGEFMAMDRLDQIYPANTTMFDMTTPSEWWGYVSEIDPTARIYPYLYPPIWAKLTAWLTQVITFETFDVVMAVIHQALILASIALAARMCALRGAAMVGFVAITYAALAFTFPVGIAIDENQPQIIVSFLIVWAFERAHSGHLKFSGGILALAAAIKLYPLLFVVIFIARKQWGAVTSFAIVGGLLGGTSILLVGWDIHAEYLHFMGLVSKSVIVTSLTFSFDSIFARYFFLESLTNVRQPRDMTEPGYWAAMVKPDVWLAISTLTQLLAISIAYWIARSRPHEPLVMPAIAVLFAFISPLSWCYTYMTSLVFLGALPIRLGRPGAYLVLAVILFFLPLMSPITVGTVFGFNNIFQILGTAMMVMTGIAFVCCFWRKPAIQSDVGHV